MIESASATDPSAAEPGLARDSAIRRNLIRLTVIILLGCAALVGASLLVPMYRLSRTNQILGARRGVARLVRGQGWAVAAFSFEETVQKRIGGRAASQLLRRLAEIGHSASADKDDRLVGKRATAQALLTLRGSAEEVAAPTALIEPGTVMVVSQQSGDWVFMAVPTPGGMKTGWTTRDRITIVP